MSGTSLLLLTPLRQALERIDKLKPGWLVESCPQIDWKGAMGFRDVIFPGSYRINTLILMKSKSC